MAVGKLLGPRFELAPTDTQFPQNLRDIEKPPERLFGIGNPEALKPGLAVIGARKATPYGRGCAFRFARIAAAKGLPIISGGARGCDSESHCAALDAGGTTVVFLGGGCDQVYPKENFGLFQKVIDAGGAVLSEQPWDSPAMPYMFRARNRLIAGLAEAVLIVEAGLPSGTFSTADDALACGKEVLVVPGSITSSTSRGSNRLLYQGAIPVVDDESFEDVLFATFGSLRAQFVEGAALKEAENPLLAALLAEPMSMERLFTVATSLYGENAREKLMAFLVEFEAEGVIEHYRDGRWGPVVKGK